MVSSRKIRVARAIAIAAFSAAIASAFALSRSHSPCMATTDRPVLVASPREFDFGELGENAVVSTEFKLENQGSSSLSLIDVATSCGCTGAYLSSRDLASGQAGTL